MSKKEKPRSKVYSLKQELVVSIPPSIIEELDINDGTDVEWSINLHNKQAYLKPIYPKSRPLISGQEKLVYKTIKLVYEAKKVLGQDCTTGEVYRTYKILAERLGDQPLTLRRVSGIIKEFSDEGLIETRVESGGRYGRTKKIIGIK